MDGFADLTGYEISYYIRTKGNNTCCIILSIICTHRKNIGTDKEYENADSNHVPGLEDMELGLLNTAKNPIH